MRPLIIGVATVIFNLSGIRASTCAFQAAYKRQNVDCIFSLLVTVKSHSILIRLTT